MLARVIPMALGFAALCAGCATAEGPGPQASAATQECKVVTVYSATDQLHNQNVRGVPGSDIAKADGAAESGRVAAVTPLRTPSRLDSMPAEIARRC